MPKKANKQAKQAEPVIRSAPLYVPKSLRDRINLFVTERENKYVTPSEMMNSEGFKDKNSLWIAAMREFLDKRSSKR